MSILVTGGAGFIGSHLIDRLLAETDESVVCIDNFNEYYDSSLKRENVSQFEKDRRVQLVEADFCDEEQVAALFSEHQFQQVMHLGAYAGVRYSMDHPMIFQQTNVLGTLSLLEAARRYPVKRFVFASSSTIYGSGATAPFVEDEPLGTPASPYGASKRAGELLCELYWQQHGVPTVSLRLFSVYGPRLRPDLAMSIFTGKIAAGQPLPLYGDGSVQRDFTHVHDICSGFLNAISAEGVVGEAINLGHNQPVEISRLIGKIEKQVGRQAMIQYQDKSPGDLPTTHANLSKAKKLLDYKTTIDIEEGIAEFVAWYLQRNKKR